MTSSHRFMNYHRAAAARWLEAARTSQYCKDTYIAWRHRDLQHMSYYAQNVADELGLPRRGILK